MRHASEWPPCTLSPGPYPLSLSSVRGSTAKHKGKASPIFTFTDGKAEVTVTLDLKEGTLKFTHGGRSIGTIASIRGPLHAAVTLTSSKQQVRQLTARGRGRHQWAVVCLGAGQTCVRCRSCGSRKGKGPVCVSLW